MSTDSWPIVPLGEVLRHRKEFIRVDDTTTYRRCRVQLHAQGVVERDIVPGVEIRTKAQQVCRAGEFLVAEIDAKVGGFGIVPDGLDGAVVSSHYFLFGIDRSRLEQRFLDYFIRTPAFSSQIAAQGSTNYAAIRPQHVLGYGVPLPPLTEQRRIVRRIEDFASRIVIARHEQRGSRASSKAALPASLSAVFRDLAARHPVQALDTLSTDIADGPHKTPIYVPQGIPFVTVKNMVSGVLDLRDLQYISPEDHRGYCRRARAERGDVLYSKDGATRGVPCYVDTEDEFSFFVSVALIKPKRDCLDGRFLSHFLNSTQIRDRVAERSRGDMIPHIVLKEIRDFPVPAPPLFEQFRIVAHLDALQAKVDAVKSLQTQSAAELDALLPSILDKAFRGEL